MLLMIVVMDGRTLPKTRTTIEVIEMNNVHHWSCHSNQRWTRWSRRVPLLALFTNVNYRRMKLLLPIALICFSFSWLVRRWSNHPCETWILSWCVRLWRRWSQAAKSAFEVVSHHISNGNLVDSYFKLDRERRTLYSSKHEKNIRLLITKSDNYSE